LQFFHQDGSSSTERGVILPFHDDVDGESLNKGSPATNDTDWNPTARRGKEEEKEED